MATDPLSSPQREQAYRSLRRLLILQQIPAGERLREPEWATRLGVHRTALREAFARLEGEGLVERGAQTGYFVPNLTDDDLLEITKLRLALETLAVDEICEEENAPALRQRLKPLARACDEFDQFLRGGYSLGVIEADRRFHEALIDAANSRRLTAIYSRAPLPILHRTMQDTTGFHEVCRETISEHRQILAALTQRDAKLARSLLRKHLTKRSIVPICS